ncbi:hypothetical protein LMH73_023175 [Vibrio splendidus]|nr:hypothetical protein [Vibrio splendidus]MCC4883222.1 hypothetical protein [Vibrio splendidus]
MSKSFILKMLETATVADIPRYSNRPCESGWKISIQGKCIEDSVYLFEHLSDVLAAENISHKIATAYRHNYHINKGEQGNNRSLEQSRKAMTIYCPNDMDIKDLCEKVYALIPDYKGWYDVATPTSYEHYAGGLFIRNDRDENGEYVVPN